MRSLFSAPVTQPKIMSFVEAVANVIVGYGVALVAQVILFPLFGLQLPLGDNLVIAGIFTVISIVRSYVLRRLFEGLRVRRGMSDTAAPLGGGYSRSREARQSAMR